MSVESAPGVPAQIAFIVDNTRGASDVLDHSARVAILTCVMLELGETASEIVTDMPDAHPPEVDINLDLLARDNPGVLFHIYNIVAARRTLMNTPAC